MKKTVISLGIALATLPFFARGAEATVAVALGGPELAAISDVIVHARVISVGGHTTMKPLRVFTDAELEVIEPLKGAGVGEHLHVSYPGGVADGLGMMVSGQVALQAQSECVIYLKRMASGALIPAAMTQGYFTVQRRAYDGVRVGYKNTSGLALVEGRGVLQHLNDKPQELVRPLGQVLDDIRADLVSAQKVDPHFLESKTARELKGGR